MKQRSDLGHLLAEKGMTLKGTSSVPQYNLSRFILKGVDIYTKTYLDICGTNLNVEKA